MISHKCPFCESRFVSEIDTILHILDCPDDPANGSLDDYTQTEKHDRAVDLFETRSERKAL